MTTDRFESQETQDDIAYLGTPIVGSAGLPINILKLMVQ